jgi:hypothetical protein
MSSIFDMAAENALLKCPENSYAMVYLDPSCSKASRSRIAHVVRYNGNAIIMLDSDLGRPMSYAKFISNAESQEAGNSNYPIVILKKKYEPEDEAFPQDKAYLSCINWWDFGNGWIYAYNAWPQMPEP